MGSMNEKLPRSRRIWVNMTIAGRRWIKRARHRWQRLQNRNFWDENAEHKPQYNRYKGWAD